MFNVWLPTVLESRQPDGENAIQGALNEYVLYAVAGCPGSVVSRTGLALSRFAAQPAYSLQLSLEPNECC